MMTQLRFAAHYIFKPTDYSKPMNEHTAAYYASDIMDNPDFRTLGGRSLSIDATDGIIHLDTVSQTDQVIPNSKEVHQDALILHLTAKHLDKAPAETTARQSVNRLLNAANSHHLKDHKPKSLTDLFVTLQYQPR